MVRSLLFIAPALLALSSCKKDYHCECNTVAVIKTGSGTFATETFAGANSSYGEKMKQAQAEAICANEEKLVANNVTNWYTDNGKQPLEDGESITTECSIK